MGFIGGSLYDPLSNTRENIRHDLRLRLRALRAAVVQTHAHRAGFHVATADDQHCVDAQLFRVGDLRLERRRAEIRIHAHHVRAQFVHDGLGVVDQRFVVVERDDPRLIRREAELEVARIMLDEAADEPFMRAEPLSTHKQQSRKRQADNARVVRGLLIITGNQ